MIMTKVMEGPRAAHSAADEVVFAVIAKAEPQALLRVLDIFARRDLLPSRVDACVTPAGLRIDIRLTCNERDAALLSASLNAQTCVAHAEAKISR